MAKGLRAERLLLYLLLLRWNDAFQVKPMRQGLLPQAHCMCSGPHQSRLYLNQRISDDAYFSSGDMEESTMKDLLVLSILKIDPAESLIPVELRGVAELPRSNNQNVTCAVLTQSGVSRSTYGKDEKSSQRCLLVPIERWNQYRIIELASAKEGLGSLVNLLRWNTVLVNRDGGLFDNLPYAAWTVDPQLGNRDAAGNPQMSKFHPGKRSAYNRLTGKDWTVARQTRASPALQGLASQLQRAQASSSPQLAPNDQPQNDVDGKESSQTLARRILELQIKETEMEIAECDYQMAVNRNDPDSLTILQMEKESLLKQLEAAREQLEENFIKASSSSASFDPVGIASKWFEVEEKEQTVSTMPRSGPGNTNNAGDDLRAFSSPYDMLKTIIRDQFNAEVIATVLENASLLENRLSLGGVLVLRRRVAKKSVNIAGEKLEVNDEDETFGNENVKGGELLLVECFADEAIGMSLACDLPLRVEQAVWEQGSVMASPVSSPANGGLRKWRTDDQELSLLDENQPSNQSATERSLPIRIPTTTPSLFDSIFSRTKAPASSDALFPVDNPIESLSQYDELSSEDKARTLLSMSNFEGSLPRPRALRQSDSDRTVLDDMLLPLIDESVRRQYLIRDAKRRGDTVAAEELETNKSKRQIAKEKAEQARKNGAEDVAEWWEKEADFYGSLRADVTQDEGSYSRFLDRDDWYERNRQQQAKKVDKNMFGNLLDGIE